MAGFFVSGFHRNDEQPLERKQGRAIGTSRIGGAQFFRIGGNERLALRALQRLHEGAQGRARDPAIDRVLAFQQILIRAGIPSFIRRPRGRDIYAACGQLKHTTELVEIK